MGEKQQLSHPKTGWSQPQFKPQYLLYPDPTIKKIARVHEPKSGRSMHVLSDAPALQLYTDNNWQSPHCSFCLETSEIPDAMDHSGYPSKVLRPGDIYRQVTIHSFHADTSR